MVEVWFFSEEELSGMKKDVNKPNRDCLASACRLAPFQPRLLLNYPENRREEPCTPAFLAAFVLDLCQSGLKQEPGSGTPPSSCNVSCGDLASQLPADPAPWHDASPGSSCRSGSLPPAPRAPMGNGTARALTPEHAASRSTKRTFFGANQSGTCQLSQMQEVYFLRGSSAHGRNMPWLSLMVAAAQAKDRALGTPSPHLGYWSLCKMIWGQKSSLAVTGLFNEQP